LVPVSGRDDLIRSEISRVSLEVTVRKRAPMGLAKIIEQLNCKLDAGRSAAGQNAGSDCSGLVRCGVSSVSLAPSGGSRRGVP
jgi:hypothetical protein